MSTEWARFITLVNLRDKKTISWEFFQFAGSQLEGVLSMHLLAEYMFFI
jgi:hypothetical protein